MIRPHSFDLVEIESTLSNEKQSVTRVYKTPPLPRADGRGGVFFNRVISADGNQPIDGNIVLDRTSEADSFTIIDGRDINAAPQELVDECLIVIGTHTSPAGVADLTIEDCY